MVARTRPEDDAAAAHVRTLLEPWRARPVPFCLYGFLVVRAISPRVLVLWVPARRLASCQLTTRARMSGRAPTPKTPSASSTVPTVSLARLMTSHCIGIYSLVCTSSAAGSALLSPAPASARRRRRVRCCGSRPPDRARQRHVFRRRPLDRVADQHQAALGARHRARDQDQAALGIGAHHLEVQHRHPAVAHVPGHLLAREGAARILAIAGRAVAAVGDRHAVGRPQAAEVVPLHRAGEALADRGAGDVDVLAGDEMVGGDLGADLEQGVGDRPGTRPAGASARPSALAKWPRIGLVTFFTLASPTPSWTAV